MEHTILITLLTALIAISSALVYILYHGVTKPKESITPTILDAAIASRNIYQVLFELKQELHADNISLFRFHNGGHYKNRFDMIRFTCVSEVYTEGSTKPMQSDYVGTLIERYAEAMSGLMYLDEYYQSDIDFCPDIKFKIDAKRYGHKSIYLYLIRQLCGEGEAFISVNFKNQTKMDSEMHMKVKAVHNIILNYLNMVKK